MILKKKSTLQRWKFSNLIWPFATCRTDSFLRVSKRNRTITTTSSFFNFLRNIAKRIFLGERFPSTTSPEPPTLALSEGWVERKYSLASKLRKVASSPFWEILWPSCQIFAWSPWKAFLLFYLKCWWSSYDNVIILTFFHLQSWFLALLTETWILWEGFESLVALCCGFLWAWACLSLPTCYRSS